MEQNITWWLQCVSAIGLIVLTVFSLGKLTRYYIQSEEVYRETIPVPPVDPIAKSLHAALDRLNGALENPVLYPARLLKVFLFRDTWRFVESSSALKAELSSQEAEAIGLAMKSLHLLLEDQQAETALATADEGLKHCADQPMALVARLAALVIMDRFQVVQDELHRLPRLESDDPDFLVFQAVVRMGLQDPATALPLLQRAIELESNRLDYRIHLMQCLKELKRFDEWKEQLQQLDRATEDNPHVRELRIEYHIHQKEWDRALELAKQFVSVHPRFAGSWLSLARVHWQAERYDEALECCLHAEKLDISSGSIFFWLALTTYRLERWEDAVRYARRGVELSPGRLTHHTNLAHFLLCVKNIDEAQAIVDRVLAQSPEHQHALNEQGWIHFMKDEMEKAEDCWQQSGLSDADSVKERARSLEVLERVKGEGL